VVPIFGTDLAAEVGRRLGAPVQMMHLDRGIFDETPLSVIATDTVREIGRLAGQGAGATLSAECPGFARRDRARSEESGCMCHSAEDDPPSPPMRDIRSMAT
jgi:hypothetical protein